VGFSLNGRIYLPGAGFVGGDVTGGVVVEGFAGAGAVAAGLLYFSRMDRPPLPPPKFMSPRTPSNNEVSMNITAHQVVARDKNVAAPRGPKAV